MDERHATILALSRLPGVGLKRLHEFWNDGRYQLSELDGYASTWRVAPLAHRFPKAFDEAIADVRALTRTGVRITSWGCDDYPTLLMNDPYPPPPVLYYTGEPLRHNENAIAIVGTRRASPHGLQFARELATDIAAAGIVVVSGLALGIDGAAHEGALIPPNGRTIAVLGSGHQRLHPAVHTQLANRIVAQGGAVYSLWPPTTTAQRHTFLERNRVITGMAHSLAIVEAGAPSGALNSAEHALRQGKDIFVMPGRPGDPRVRGNLRLLADGATPLITADDMLSDFALAAQRYEPVYTYDVSKILAEHGELPLDALSTAAGLELPELLEQLAFAQLAGEVRQTVAGTYCATKGGAKLST